MRIRSLDSIRFIAAFCVAVFHFNIDLKWGLDERIGAIRHFGLFVDLFFALSGFVIALNYADRVGSPGEYATFLKRRLARIYPLHLATLMAFAGIGLLAQRLHVPVNHPEFFAASALPANILLVQAWGFLGHGSFNNASWSVSAELFVYLVFPLLAATAARLRPTACIVLIAAYLLTLCAARASLGLPSWTGATFDYGNLRAVPTFFLGVVLARLVPLVIARLRIGWAAVWLLLALALAAMEIDAPDEVVILLLVGLIVAGAGAEISGRDGILLSRPLVLLGDASYAIYMTHGLVLMALTFALRKTVGLGTPMSGLAGAAGLVVTLALSILVYRGFEAPCRRLLGEVSFRPRRRVPA